MEALQNLLTIAIETVAIAGFGGIALHAIWSSHCNWMNEYCPPVKPFEEPVIEDSAPTPEPIADPTPAPTPEPIAEPTPVAPALSKSKYEIMTVKQLRQECQIHCIDWKRGGDYGKAMRKNQMIRALTA